MSSKSRPSPRPVSLELAAPIPSSVIVEVASEEETAAKVEGEASPADVERGKVDRAAPAKGRSTRSRSKASGAKGAGVQLTVVADAAEAGAKSAEAGDEAKHRKLAGPEVKVRRLHRRDLNKTWEFLKLVFRDVNRETVEYQRPRSKRRFLEVYEDKGEQLLFEAGDQIVGYAECAFDPTGADNWINPRYFDKRGMRPLYVEELAVHPDYQGRGVGGFMLDQLQHMARIRGCTHLVLEVAENNESALSWYRKRNFYKLDAAIFMAQKISAEPELLPPRRLPNKRNKDGSPTTGPVPEKKPSGGSRRAPRTTSSRAAKRKA